MSPCSNRGDIIEEKWVKEKEKRPRTKENVKKGKKKKSDQGEKPKCCVVLSSNTGHESKREITFTGSVRCYTRGWEKSLLEIAAGHVYFCGWVLTLLESHAYKWRTCGSVDVLGSVKKQGESWSTY